MDAGRRNSLDCSNAKLEQILQGDERYTGKHRNQFDTAAQIAFADLAEYKDL